MILLGLGLGLGLDLGFGLGTGLSVNLAGFLRALLVVVAKVRVLRRALGVPSGAPFDGSAPSRVAFCMLHRSCLPRTFRCSAQVHARECTDDMLTVVMPTYKAGPFHKAAIWQFDSIHRILIDVI